MNKIFASTGLRWTWLTLLVLMMDLSSKFWVMTHFWIGKSVEIMPFLNFTYVHNFGAAFSFLADREGYLQRWIISIISILIIVLLLTIMYRSNYRVVLPNIAYSIIIGGALGNLLNRIMYGVVIDFIDFYVGNWHWPIFNVADISICIGTILIIIDGLFISNKSYQKKY